MNDAHFRHISVFLEKTTRDIILNPMAIENMANFRNFDTLTRHVRFLKKKLGRIYYPSRSSKVACEFVQKTNKKKADNDIFFCSGEKRRQARHFGIGFIKKDPLVISQSQILHPPSPQNFSCQIVWKLGAKLEVPTGARLTYGVPTVEFCVSRPPSLL